MLKTLFLSFLEDILRGLSGSLGIRIRRAYYGRRLKRCGKRLTIEVGVHIIAPSWISLGTDVWLDRNSVLIAGPAKGNAHVKLHQNENAKVQPGEIMIGDGSHIGIGAIIQGHGGVKIDSCFTAAPHAKIYSFSNDYHKCWDGTIQRAGIKQYYLLTPVFIGRNVWIGINSVVIGHSIGANCFIKPGAVVATNIPENSVLSVAQSFHLEPRFHSKEHTSENHGSV